ncbi:MAG: ECF-type sigma factor [Phycisphaerales bacterium]|nr:ECF-type sigma factor [Phycisphaerales bacterium]
MSAPPEHGELQDSIYQHLHAIAVQKMAGERYDHTLQPTALINEAWLRLGSDADKMERSQFVGMAALAMKRILVDHARARGRLKRGGDRGRIRGDWDVEADFSIDSEESVSLVDAMQRLEERDPRACQVVVLRVLGGLEIGAIAQCLEVSERTAKRDWRFAKAWLASELQRELNDDDESLGPDQDPLQ